MKNVLKMIRLDLVTAGSLTIPYVLAFIALSLVLSLFAMPLGILCFAAPLVIFGPAREAAGAEQQKIYGILPVQKSAVTRAAFLENTVMLILGEVLALLFLLISDTGALCGILPGGIAELLEDLTAARDNYDLSFKGMAVTLALLSAYLCMLSAYLEMEAEIHGHDSDIKNLLIALSATALVAAVIIALVKAGVLPPFRSWLAPEKGSGKALIVLAANAAAIAVSAAMCERTVKKTADMEL